MYLEYSESSIEDDEDRLPPEIEGDKIDDSDFELDSTSSEDEISEGENENDEHFEATTSNKENEPILDPKKAKRKVQRDAKYLRILTSSNPSNIPTYEIPNANKTNSIKSTVKDAECEICRNTFTKQVLNRQRNSCQKKEASKKIIKTLKIA